MAVSYEWDVEVVRKESDDIEDHLFQDSYADCVAEMNKPPESDCFQRIVLVRDSDAQGRSWAYMENGKLPTHFEDAYGVEVAKVPLKYVREVAEAVPA